MIRLKSLIEANESPKLQVLFVGDHQTKSNWSYARQLIRDGVVQGKIVGWTNATTAQLYRILKSNISKRYDVISIMGGDSDSKSMDPNVAIANLDRCYTLAKKYGAKVVAISNPSKLFLTPTDKFYSDSLYPSNDIISNWVATQSKTDVVINTSNFKKNAFTKDNYRLNDAANRSIASQWKSQVLALNITPRSKSSKPIDTSLRLGDSNSDVRSLQQKLIKLGYTISTAELTSSTFGSTTLKAVNEFQSDSNLPVTGIVDKTTLDLITTSSKDAQTSTDDSEETSTTDTDSEEVSVKRSDVLSGSTSEYIRKFSNIAVEQMKKYGIPASITLAQGILESGNGTSDLTTYAYNHFGIKGSYNGKKWCGKTGEYVKGKRVKTKECFRKYPNDEASFEDHSKLLLGRHYQTQVKKYATGPSDYEGWANALQAAGYVTAPGYGKALIRLIKQLNLNKYDVIDSDTSINKSDPDTDISQIQVKI